MTPNWIFIILLTFLVYFNAPCNARERRLFLRPMTGNEVYKLLHDTGREDAIPEGRIITQGIAAVAGFGVGIFKGIAGSILFDLAVSNETQQLFANMMSNWFVQGDSGSTSTTSSTESQEICFNSRSLNEIDDDYDEEMERQITTDTTGYMEEPEIEPIAVSRQKLGATTSPTLADTDATITNKPSFLTSPGLTQPTTGTAASSLSSAPDDGKGFINCIVINKPVAKKRRRRSINKLIKHTSRSKGYRRRSKRFEK